MKRQCGGHCSREQAAGRLISLELCEGALRVCAHGSAWSNLHWFMDDGTTDGGAYTSSAACGAPASASSLRIFSYETKVTRHAGTERRSVIDRPR